MQTQDKKLGIAGKLAQIFVSNDRLSILVIIAIFAWGIFSFVLTPKQYNPEIIAPAFNIITEFPGATNQEVLELVTKPMENRINDIPGIDEIMSQSIDGGASIITVKFFVGENLEDSKIKLTQKIGSNIDLKPLGVTNPVIKEINLDDVPVLVFALSSDTLSNISLRKLALQVGDEIKNTKNATNVEVFGGTKKEIKIALDNQELNTQGISILEIVDILQKNNIKLPAGEIETNTEKITVEINSHIHNEDEVKNIVLRKNDEHIVYLSDVAQISTSEEDIKNYVHYQEKDQDISNTVFLSIAKKKGSNISQVTQDVSNKINILQGNLIPKTVKVTKVRDEGQTANEEIFGLLINLLQAIFIVFVILLIFLGRRPAIVVAVAIPLVLASVFGAGLLAGQTINRITLFALILSLGLLVDNATVVIENAVRHTKDGKDLKKSIITAVDEVGMGLIMSTITTLFAFFPMAFISGMMGPYMGPIPFFVPAALIFSLLIAFTINPYLSSVLLKKTKNKTKTNKLAELKIKIEDYYQNVLKNILYNPQKAKKVLIYSLIVFLLVMILPAFGIVKFRMLPKADREQFYVYLDYPENTLLEENKKITSQVEDLLLKEKEIISIQSFIGTSPIIDFNGLFKGSSARNQDYHATIKVNLTHHDTRKEKSEKIVLQLRSKIEKLLENEKQVKLKLIEDPPGPPVLSTVLVKIKGRDYEKMKGISQNIEQITKDTKEVVDVDSTLNDKVQKIKLSIDYDKAGVFGIDAQNAALALNIALQGQNISVLHNDQNQEQEYISMRLKKDDRNEIADLESIYLSNNQGEKIPLLEIVKEENINLPDTIQQDNREKTIYVNAEMGNRSVTYAMIDIYRKLLKDKLPAIKNSEITKVSFFGIDFLDRDTNEIYKIEWGGEWKLTVEVFRDLGIAMMVAIFLIYLVLVAQFGSFRVPLLIMMTIPLAMIGVMPGFAILGATLGIYFNATSMIGVIALAGIVVNNAIIMIEYLDSFRGQGIKLEEALIKTGVTRMRPIMLTSLTTILGSLAIIGDPVWAGLAWSIIFGISISTVLTLVVFPTLYYTFAKKKWN